jgi:hypothetical protein
MADDIMKTTRLGIVGVNPSVLSGKDNVKVPRSAGRKELVRLKDICLVVVCSNPLRGVVVAGQPSEVLTRDDRARAHSILEPVFERNTLGKNFSARLIKAIDDSTHIGLTEGCRFG